MIPVARLEPQITDTEVALVLPEPGRRFYSKPSAAWSSKISTFLM